MKRPLRAILALVALLTGALALMAGSASAGHLSCDPDPIMATTDITLDENLTCPGAGIIVKAAGITINLGGYTLTGPGDPNNDDDPEGTGVDNTDGYDNVTIKNGTLENWDEGVELDEASHNKLLKLRIIGPSDEGVDAQNADHLLIRHTTVTDSGETGFNVEASDYVRIEKSTSRGAAEANFQLEVVRYGTLRFNKAFDSVEDEGFGLENFDDGWIVGNIARGNADDGEFPDGFTLDADSKENVFRGNLPIRSGGDGYSVDDAAADNNTFIANAAIKNGGDGFDVFDSSTVLRRNLALFNDGWGDLRAQRGHQLAKQGVRQRRRQHLHRVHVNLR